MEEDIHGEEQLEDEKQLEDEEQVDGGVEENYWFDNDELNYFFE